MAETEEVGGDFDGCDAVLEDTSTEEPELTILEPLP